MPNELFEIIKIGGPPAVIVALFIWYIDRQDKRVNNLISNHFRHSTNATLKLNKTLQKLTTLVDDKLKAK